VPGFADNTPAVRLRFRLLGQLGAGADGTPLALGPLKQRTVLAALLAQPNTLVPTDLLTDAVWQDDPPRTARKNLQVYVSALRRLFHSVDRDDERVVYQSDGYLLRAAEPELDTLEFESLARAGREAAAEGARESAARMFARALRLWDGPPLPELRHSPVLRATATRLTTRYVAAVEDWAENQLALGNPRAVVNALADLAEQNPLRERLRALQLTALHRAGRRAEALAVFSELRQQLSRELGLSPSPELEACYRTILSDQAAPKDAPADPAAPARRPGPSLLPPDIPDFTGRTEELAALTGAVRRGERLVLVTGPVGIGKSALAVHAAHRLRNDFPDGHLFLRLGQEDGAMRPLEALTAELGRLTGDGRISAADPEQGLTVWRSWLAGRRMLLVLDDARDTARVRALLPVAGDSAVVVTSRAPLAGLCSARRIDLPPQTTTEALELLAAMIGHQRFHSDPAAAERIVTACGLLPLAVCVAGHKLAVLRHVPLAEFADRLSDPHCVLDELAVGGIAVRHRLSDQWNELDAPGRAALARLGQLPLTAPFTLDQAVGLLGQDRRQTLCELERLIAAGVVVSPAAEVSAHTARYALPPLTHIYARECR